MLEFIVLGEVPGTSIQLGFHELIQLGFFVLAIVLIRIELHIHKVERPKLQDIIDRISL